MVTRFVLLACLLASPAAAEQTPAWPGAQQAIANAVSNAALSAQLGLDVLHSVRSASRRSAFFEQGCALGMAFGVDEILKRTIHRERPDGSDNLSFPSGHTGIAAAAGGWNFGWSAGLTELVAFGRMGANKHHPTDVAAGAAIGTGARLLARRVCR